LDVSKRRVLPRLRWLAPAALPCVLLMLMVAAVPVDTRWGKEWCSLVTHCYDLQSWTMAGGSETIKGGQLVVTTNLMNVQEYGSARVSNEMWVGFPEKHGGWFETGQIAGDNPPAESCCTIHPFIAHSQTATLAGYEEYVWTTVPAEPRNLYTIEDAEANHN